MRAGLLAIAIFALALPACSGSSRARGPISAGAIQTLAGAGQHEYPELRSIKLARRRRRRRLHAGQGDCNDCDPGMNPGAIEIGGNGQTTTMQRQIDDNNRVRRRLGGQQGPERARARDRECDTRFFKGAMMAGPSDMQARNVLANFGILKPKVGANFALLRAASPSTRWAPASSIRSRAPTSAQHRHQPLAEPGGRHELRAKSCERSDECTTTPSW